MLREDQKENRKKYICGTDAYICLSGSPISQLNLYNEKLGIERRELHISEAMERGSDLEDTARQYFSNILGKVFWPDFIVSSKYPFMAGSVDGIDFDRKHGLEIKCPTQRTILDLASTGQYDKKHYVQMHQYMIVADLKEWTYGIYFSEDDAHHFTIKRDDYLCEKIIEANKKFWHCVQSKTPPFEIRSDEMWKHLEDQYIKHAEKKKEYESLAKEEENYSNEILNELKKIAGDKGSISDRLILTRYTTKGTVKYKEIPELANVNLEQYRGKEKVCWRATIRKNQT